VLEPAFAVTDPNSLAYKLHSHDPLSPAAQGRFREMFFDKSLSASGKLACSSCHDPRMPTAPATIWPFKWWQVAATVRHRGCPRCATRNTCRPTRPVDNPDGSIYNPVAVSPRMARATRREQAKNPVAGATRWPTRNDAESSRRSQVRLRRKSFRQAFGAGSPDPNAALQKAARHCKPSDGGYSFHPYSSKYDLYAANKLAAT